MTIGKTSLAVLAIAFSALPAGAAEWRKMTPAQFPAQVRSIAFATGNVLDSFETLTWGAWTVGFGPQAPVASALLNHNGSLAVILMEKLRCTNRIIGESECKMSLVLSRNAHKPCTIWGGNVPEILIACPVSVELE